MKMHLALLFAVAVLGAARAGAQENNPHNGYAFWLPNGELKLGDRESEKAFGYKSEGVTERTTNTRQWGNGFTETRPVELLGGSETLTIPLRRTRFDVPSGHLVIVPIHPGFAGSTGLEISVVGPSGTPVRAWRAHGYDQDYSDSHWQTAVYVLPKLDTSKVRSVTLIIKPLNHPARLSGYRFYYTDDVDAWPLAEPGRDAHGQTEPVQTEDLGAAFGWGLKKFWDRDYPTARALFGKSAAFTKGAGQARNVRRFIRWCDAEMRYPKIEKTDGKGYYNLGLYCMVNGFWELAEKSFKAATAAAPKDADAWYMLGDAASYVHSDLDGNEFTVYPYYKKAADLYPRANSNVYRNRMGLFKNLRVSDGKGGSVLMHLTPQQIADTKRKWEFCTAVLEASSRGALRFENQWVEYDKEFDNSAPLEHDPAPFEGLWQPGTVDTFMKFTGWGASDAIGPDCGANRSADVNIGMREWDVLYHEWNHTLDWLMAYSGLGIGVPETHSSDWCGFQPISSMGMGHHSCNRYYMTPGMYRFIHGSDKPTTPWISAWNVSVDELRNASSPKNDADQTRLRNAVLTMQPELNEIFVKMHATDGYVDLKASLGRNAPRNAVAWAWTYVYSPTDQKVRCWFGADDNARIWVNGDLAYTGNYWAVCKFEEAHEKDQIATMIKLRKGWNKVLMQVSNVERIRPSDNPPRPFWYGRPDAWGFSMRLCDIHNRPLRGVHYQAGRPQDFDANRLDPTRSLQWVNTAPKTYAWAAVKEDYTQDLPHLQLEDLRDITGYKGLTVTNEMLFDPGQAPVGAAGHFHTGKADPSEVALNNELNWFFSPREMVAMLRYRGRGGKARDLVFLRPEMYEPFMALAKVAPEATSRGIKSHANQVVGYFTVPRGDSPNGRIVLVLDTYLGDNPPTDEEDLLGLGA